MSGRIGRACRGPAAVLALALRLNLAALLCPVGLVPVQECLPMMVAIGAALADSVFYREPTGRRVIARTLPGCSVTHEGRNPWMSSRT